MKKGDIVVCIQYPELSEEYYLHSSVYWDSAGISQGTKYEVMGSWISKSGKFITIANDLEIISDYKTDMFKPLSEWREMKLNELGI